jgi:four helix bundle protein
MVAGAVGGDCSGGSLGLSHFRVVLGGVKDDAFGVAAFGGCFAILDSACARRGRGFASREGRQGEKLMTLRIYDFIIETIRFFAPIVRTIAKHDRALADQMQRALASVALNVSEGAGSQRGNRRLRFENACGSAKESRACYEVAAAFEYVVMDDTLVDRLDRIAATTWRLAR